jgi:ABC-2 type transport system ATP-binding protein
MPDLLVEAHDMRRSFGETRAVDGVSLRVAGGEAYGLVGPDGAGKTTTLRLLVGALRADGGSILVDGHDVTRRPELARQAIGYLAQRFSLYADLTVAENLRFFGEARGIAGARLATRAEELLAFVGLTGFEGRRAEHLSGGMKQKLGLACALVHEPHVLLLDEPTAGVDPVTRQDFWQLAMRVLARGAAIIVSTPYMDEATRCTRIGFINGGRVLVEGTPRELADSLSGRVLELVARPARMARDVALEDADVEDVVVFGDRLHLRVRQAEGTLSRLPASIAAAGGEVTSLRSVGASIEDVFLALLAEHGR